MTIAGFIVVLGVLISYLVMLFILHRFTYKTWIFDVAVGAGMVIEVVGWLQSGGSWLSWSTMILGASVDEPEAAAPIQEHIGNNITILCDVSEQVLKKIGVLDTKERLGMTGSSLVLLNNQSQCLLRSSSTRRGESFS